jgi:uncharacterized repeat protein (TIGR01451 family)/uncharacterized repeat protein (TIGR02543 family)/LPXTG-motif cell wall-anchored protein
VLKVYYVKGNFGYSVEYYYDNVRDDSLTVTGSALFGSPVSAYTPQPKDGYVFSSDNTPITITAIAANNVIKVYYVKGSFGYSVEYYYDNVRDDSLTVTGSALFGSPVSAYTPQPKTGYDFLSDNTPITISAIAANNIIKVHYVKDNFGYTVEYYYDGEKDGALTETGSAEFGAKVDQYTPKPKDGYVFSSDTTPITISAIAANNVIEVYYVKDNFDYRIEYYYDNVIDDTKTVTGSALFGSDIDSYDDKVVDGYELDRVEPTPLPMTITSDENANVIKVYYTAIPYNVYYMANGGSGTMTDENNPYTYMDIVTVKANGFTRSGYNFNGWNTMANGSGTARAVGTTFTMPAEDVTLYAQWSVIPSSTTYSMSLTKTANATTVDVGDTITYTIVLRNTGGGTLTNVTVADPLVGLNEVVTSLAPGATRTFTVTYIPLVAGTLTNNATASDNQAPFTSASATVTVLEPIEEIIIEEPEVPLDIPVVEEPEEIVIMEEEVPLAIPATGTDPTIFMYGAGALLSLLGLFKRRRF